jgi:DNA polymerase III subunit chi
MAELLFYHLERSTLEDVLPGLLERTRERDWRAVVRIGSAERMETLDAHLWTYSEQSFLAHGTAAEGHPSRQPIFLTTEEENPNSAQVLFLVAGAQVGDWSSPSLSGFSRIVLMFDGRETEAVDYARSAWRRAKEAGYDVTYWKESASGKWEKQA